MAGEDHSVCGESVDVGRLEPLLTVTAQVSVAEVVGDDEYYVRVFLLLFCVRAGGQGQHPGAEDNKFSHRCKFTKKPADPKWILPV